MNAVYIAVAIPIFFLLIGVESWLGRRRGVALYEFADSITDLSCGIGQQVTQVFLKGAQILLYVVIFERLRLFDAPATTWWSWVALLVLLDLGYYAFHRASHRVNFIWATHVVHHQSEEFNLAVALRQSVLQSLFSTPFYLPLALLGFPPLMFVGARTINTLYQFWIHTRLVGRLGPLEWVLNTPSHHRVHHGINPKYIDRNYAGMFIVWDRLFGTFEVEEEEPAYGTVKPLASWNPLWANVDYWVTQWKMAAATRRLGDKLLVWLAPPEWRPADLGGPVVVPEVARDAQPRYRTRVSRAVRRWVVANFVLVAGATTGLILVDDRLPPWGRVALVGLVLATLAAWGALFEARRWALPLELVRIGGAVAVAVWLARGTPWLAATAAAAVAAGAGLVGWLLVLRRGLLAAAPGVSLAPPDSGRAAA